MVGRALLLLVLLLYSAPGWAGSDAAFRPAPSARDPWEVARTWLAAEGEPDDARELVVLDRHTTARGITHIHAGQRLGGIDVFNSEASTAIDASGRLVSVGDRLVRGLVRRPRA